ncbi:cytochrome P450 [Streptomyces solicathayae]|uniref:Cytochrome P450 n=1 Tax=Streptomyces solicathayae TaxID=3081768 RepID=A0ABZ0LZ98_9ACTN|nr:cytochrome P450 [Streptomyces sp. HUAS YS2]WOX24690.1 cytochrome P450 [Streptomyces sp. HUAS YS2]
MIDLLEDTWAREVPYDQFAYLRRESPVHWHPLGDDGDGFFALTRHADIVAASRDPELWSVERGSFFIREQTPEALETLALSLLGMDPPRHTRYRRLVSTVFSPRMIRRLAEDIQRRAELLADSVAARGGEVEFVEEVAARLPLQVICEMVGVPAADEDRIFAWSNRLVGFQDPDFRTTEEDGQVAAAEIYAYCDELAARRRAEPRDDILTALVHAEVDGERLTAHEIDLFFVTLVVAGNETTRNLLAGALLTLARHPAARAQLVAGIDDDGLWTSATEELLRWNGSIHNFRRTATRDTEIGGQKIREGQKAVLFYTSGNRDESVFADPDVLDLRRSPNDHLTFGGGGPHFCLGAGLARTQIKALTRELLRRHPHVETTDEPRRMRSDFINGIKYLPLRFAR